MPPLLTTAGVAEKSKLTATFRKRKIGECAVVQEDIESLKVGIVIKPTISSSGDLPAENLK